MGKDIGSARLVASGAGAAALACLDLLVDLGLRKENVVVTDIAGVVYEGRTAEMDPYKARYAVRTDARTLADVLEGADIFLGLSAAGVLKPGVACTVAELDAFAQGQLGRYKKPKVIRIVESLPKGPSGKVQRLKLTPS